METRLYSDLGNEGLVPDHPDFCILCRDRSSQRGGGAFITVKEGIPSSRLRADSEIESVSKPFHCSYKHLITGVYYYPTNASSDFIDCLYGNLAVDSLHNTLNSQ